MSCALLVAGIFAAYTGHAALAASCATNPDLQSCSANYGVGETFFGTGGLDTCPTQGTNAFCAKQSAGELTVGNTSSANYQAQAGFNTDRTPYLEVIFTKSAVDLGVVSDSAASTDTATFRVKSYLSSGYVAQIYGSTPTNGSYSVATIAAPYTSSPGTEQFGINLVANTTPSVGANPVQDTDSAHSSAPFGFGAAVANYNTPNQFRYGNGDIIASSAKSSGYTDYTISYLLNISNVTPGGTYVANQSVVVTATY